MSTYSVDIGKLVPSKTNPRKQFDGPALIELTKSVKQHGVLQPILVRPVAGNGHFEIVAGERRFRAAKAAGLTAVPATVRELSDKDALEIQVIENLQRQDLHQLEEAEGYRQLLKMPGYDAAKIAERVGRSVKYIYDRIKLLNLIEPIRTVFLDGRITAGHAILLARLTPPDQQRAFGHPARGQDGGLWQDASTMFDEARDGKDPLSGYKAVSVRELEEWITEHVRFDAERADAFLFPETVSTMKSAQKEAEKVVHITQEHLIERDARDPSRRTIVPTSWERADGKQGSKLCERSVIGVVVVGEGRGQAFRVCINKEKCKIHWGQWQKERAQRAKYSATAVAKDGGTAAQRYEHEQVRRKAEEARQEAERARWKTAMPAILKAVAVAVKKAPTKASGLLAQLVIRECAPNYGGLTSAAAASYVPVGATAEDVLRHAAFMVLAHGVHGWSGPREFPKRAKALGIDVQKILDQAAPVEQPVQTSAKAPATAAKAKQPARAR